MMYINSAIINTQTHGLLELSSVPSALLSPAGGAVSPIQLQNNKQINKKTAYRVTHCMEPPYIPLTSSGLIFPKPTKQYPSHTLQHGPGTIGPWVLTLGSSLQRTFANPFDFAYVLGKCPLKQCHQFSILSDDKTSILNIWIHRGRRHPFFKFL